MLQGGINGHILMINSVNLSDAGVYTCTNGGFSATVNVTVNNRMCVRVHVCMYVCMYV